MIKWLKRKIFGEKLKNYDVIGPAPKKQLSPYHMDKIDISCKDTKMPLGEKGPYFRYPKESLKSSDAKIIGAKSQTGKAQVSRSIHERNTEQLYNSSNDFLSPLNPLGPLGPIIDAGHIWRSPEPSPSSTDSSHSQHHTPSHSSSHDHSSYDGGSSSYDSGSSSDCGTSSDSGSSGCDGC